MRKWGCEYGSHKGRKDVSRVVVVRKIRDEIQVSERRGIKLQRKSRTNIRNCSMMIDEELRRNFSTFHNVNKGLH